MDYIPRYAQPFTLREAVGLDVAVITEEISRLQNSLNKLKETQIQLGEYIEESKKGGETDAEVLQAMQENVSVIGSQEERISILKMALSEKGIITSGEHYDLPASNDNPARVALRESGREPSETNDNEQEEGVYL